MNTNFVIVIEADNKRAHAAYLKGLSDLDVIWPQMMVLADKRDALLAEAEAKHMQEIVERLERQNAAVKARDEWDASGSIFKGQRPTIPSSFESMLDMRRYMSPPGSNRAHDESLRRELRDMANLAGAAIGPFRMTEHQVKAMIAWEDGSRIDQIKAEISGSAA